MKTNISVIVPVRNLADCIVPFYYELIKFIPPSFELILVNDHSDDDTLDEISAITQKDQRVKCITHTQQFGNDASVLTGLDYASGEYIIVMNGDLQHPAERIPDIISKLKEGYDIVHTLCSNRQPIHMLVKWPMDFYYHVLSLLKRNDVMIDLHHFRGFNRSVMKDILFMQDKDPGAEEYFNWTAYRIATIDYFNKLNTDNHRKYSKEHIVQSTKEAFTFTIPSVTKTILFLGITLTLTCLFYFFIFIFEYYNGNKIHTDSLSLTSLLFAGGLQILLYGAHKKKIRTELHQLCKDHQRIVDQISEPDNFLSDLRFPVQHKKNSLAES